MDEKTKGSLIRANVLSVAVFVLSAAGFFAIAYVKAPSEMPPKEAYVAADSSLDAKALRAHLRTCLIAEAQHAKTLSEAPVEFAVLGAAIALIAAVVFGANAVSLRKAFAHGGSNR